MKIVCLESIKKQLTNILFICIITFASRKGREKSILTEVDIQLWRNTQEAEEAPLLRV